VKDLYLKPSMLHAISAKTKHPEAAATLVDFLINSPESGKIFGTNRGLPASSTALAAADLDPLSTQIKDYEASIKDRLGDAPPVPIVGYGSLEEKFRVLGTELNFGTITVDDAVKQFFAEMDATLQ
jgi:multiple sugar transport system substrate-binding protein